MSIATEEEMEIMANFDQAMKDAEDRMKVPSCHFTPMSCESSDHESWWICHHCGHTKEIGIMDQPY